MLVVVIKGGGKGLGPQKEAQRLQGSLGRFIRFYAENGIEIWRLKIQF